ncbi:unnamed protein product [Symbiodinium sp. CCMP2456]|nr:unnamed protein product [Symbiodinium sp. CCMP2456]
MQWTARSLWYLLCLCPATANRCDAALLRPCLESLATHPGSVRPGRAPKAESRNGPIQTVGANDLTCPEALPWEDRDSDGFRPLDGFLGFLDDCMKCNSDTEIALQGKR